MDLISVIIPTKNRLELLEKSIQSVINQTYENWELIVVDDGSTDNTKEYVNSLGEKRIQIISNEKSVGGARARNIGIEKAKGSLIAFLDDDDEWLPNKLKVQQEHFLDTDVGLSYCGCNIVFTKYSITYPTKPRIEGNVFKQLLLNNFIGVTPAVIVRKSVIAEVGAFDPDLKARQDYDLWLRVARISKIKCSAEILFNSYQRTDIRRITSSVENYILADKYILGKYEDYIQSNGTEFKISLVKLHDEFIAGQAIKAGNKKIASSYYFKSLKKKVTIKTCMLLLISFMPYKVILRLKSFSRR